MMGARWFLRAGARASKKLNDATEKFGHELQRLKDEILALGGNDIPPRPSKVRGKVGPHAVKDDDRDGSSILLRCLLLFGNVLAARTRPRRIAAWNFIFNPLGAPAGEKIFRPTQVNDARGGPRRTFPSPCRLLMAG